MFGGVFGSPEAGEHICLSFYASVGPCDTCILTVLVSLPWDLSPHPCKIVTSGSAVNIVRLRGTMAGTGTTGYGVRLYSYLDTW
jgi:hypothetical protein